MLKIFGHHDADTIHQIETCLTTGAEKAVLCADGQRGYAQPIGGVVAYRDQISISGVGLDIACGNMACRIDADPIYVVNNIASIMEDIVQHISFGVKRKTDAPIDHPVFDDPAWKIPAIKSMRTMASEELGTVGSGSHYVDIFMDENNHVWIGVHFGSRGLGYKIATYFLEKGKCRESHDHSCVVPVDSCIGTDYLEGMRLAGRYAYAGREYVCREIASKVFGSRILEEVHNHHNFAWKEIHNGVPYWVVRKGATPAFPHQRGFVGGSMGDNSYIIEGIESAESRDALYSTIHGAGRVISRTAAMGRGRWRRGKRIGKIGGTVSREEMMTWIRTTGVHLVGGNIDKAPQVYRRLNDVLREHAGTIKILHTLRPIGVAMASIDEKDPYKE